MKRDYFIFRGNQISRHHNIIRITFEDRSFKDIPVEKINALNIFNEMSFNSSCINFLHRNEIVLNFFNYYGYYTGSFYPKETNLSGEMIEKQVLASTDESASLKIAKKLIEGASGNILRNLKYYKSRGKNINTENIEILCEKICGAETRMSLMGIEGNLRKQYYQCWDEILSSAFLMENRTKRPPENEINALISLLNTMVYTVCISEIYKTHLNPAISFLHKSSRRRFSLSLDISEIFKPIMVDRLIFKLINKKMLTNHSFERGSEGIFLKEKAREKVLREFDMQLSTTLYYHPLKRHVSYRQLIRLELLKIEKHLISEEEYQPFILQW